MSEKKRILAIDDSDIVLNALSNFLSDYNFVVATAKDGLDGIIKAVLTKPDLIFLELNIPGLNGFEFLKIKRGVETTKNTPVVAITSNPNKEYVLQAVKSGCSRVIMKPLRKEAIIKFVSELLELEDVFASKSSTVIESQEDMRVDIVRAYKSSFSQKRHQLADAMQKQDSNLLFSTVHELFEMGRSMGYTDMVELSMEIESKIVKDSLDWIYLERRVRRLMEVLTKMSEEK